MRVTPLLDGQTAIFAPVGTGEKDSLTGKPKSTKSLFITKSTIVYDRFQKKSVRIGNVISENPVSLPSGEIVKQQNVSPVFITKGVHVVTSHKPQEYQYLMRHPRNGSNPFRDMDKEPLFYKVGGASDGMFEMDKEIIFDLMRSSIRSAEGSVVEDLFEKLYPKTTANDEAEMKNIIIKNLKAYKDYRKAIYEMHKDFPGQRELLAMSIAYDAIRDVHIIKHDQRNAWLWNATDYPLVVEYPKGSDPVVKLISFLKNNAHKKIHDGLLEVVNGKANLENMLSSLLQKAK